MDNINNYKQKLNEKVYYNDIPQFRDIYAEPDSKRNGHLFLSYNQNHEIPIVIDYGSATIKAGWGISENPNLVFRSLVSKTKDAKSSTTCALIATKGKEVDLFKGNYRSPFERNIVQHFGLLENINDFIFSELGVADDSRVNHPLILTEAISNPEYCRINLYEQLFECYAVPGVLMGIDALFSYFYNIPGSQMLKSYKDETALIISLSNSTCHIIPILNGCVVYTEIKRINVGGANSFEILYKSLHLRYPHLKNFLDYYKVQSINENLTCCANNYSDQMQYFQEGEKIFDRKPYLNKIQYENQEITQQQKQQGNIHFIDPIVIEFPVIKPVQNEEEVARKRETRLKQAERLKQSLLKKKQEKEVQYRQELLEMEDLEKQISNDPMVAKIKIEQFFGSVKGNGLDDVKKRQKKLRIKLGLIPKDTIDEDKFQYIDIPDSQLTPEQIRIKRIQIVQKQAAETRAEKKKLEKQKKEDIKKQRDANPELYQKSLYDKRTKILKKMQERKQQRQELSTRNSRLNQKRMQTLAQLGADEHNTKSNKEDTFGMNDEDWNIYRGISKYQDSEDENMDMKLNDIEIELREIDPGIFVLENIQFLLIISLNVKDFEDKIKDIERNPYGLNMQESYITLTADRVRGPEIFFQPTLCGIEQAGLVETIAYVVKKFGGSHQQKLLKNIQLTGGSALTNGLMNRIKQDLLSNFPLGTDIYISTVNDPLIDAWRGMRLYYQSYPDLFKKEQFTLEEYQEKGYQLTTFKPNPFSNIVMLR